MGRITSFSKQVIVLFLTFTLFFNSAFASTSNPSIGGWQVVSNIAQGVGAKITATKEVVISGVSKTLSSTANITPKASNVAKFMAKAGGLVLADLALKQLFDGVDFVLDPANNTLTYKPKSSSCASYSDCAYAPKLYSGTINGKFHGYYSSNSEYCSTLSSKFSTYYPGLGFDGVSSGTNTCSGGQYPLSKPSAWQLAGYSSKVIDNPSYNPTAPDKTKPKTVPLSNIGSQVIDQAEKDIREGKTASPAVALSRAAAQDMIHEAENDNVKPNPIAQELDKNHVYPTTETAEGTVTNPSVTDPVTGEVKPVPPSNLALDFPVFCGWAPSVCVAADVVVKAPAQISEYIESVKQEYLKEKELNTDTELDIPDPTPPDINTDISFGGSCPAPLSAPYSFFGLSGAIEFSFDPVCQIASFIKPVVISVAAFSSVLIVAGIRTEDD